MLLDVHRTGDDPVICLQLSQSSRRKQAIPNVRDETACAPRRNPPNDGGEHIREVVKAGVSQNDVDALSTNETRKTDVENVLEGIPNVLPESGLGSGSARKLPVNLEPTIALRLDVRRTGHRSGEDDHPVDDACVEKEIDEETIVGAGASRCRLEERRYDEESHTG
jgi:hypothetical protein